MKRFALTLTFFLNLAVWLGAEETTLRPGDRLELDIKGVPAEERSQVKGEYTIDDHGLLHLHLIGEVIADGEKPSSLAFKIERTYVESEMYTRPMIVVNQLSAAPRKTVTVSGGVGEPGAIHFQDSLTLIQALSRAGGIHQGGEPDKVMLTRNGKTSKHDVEAILKRKADDVVLASGDEIVVPERRLKR